MYIYMGVLEESGIYPWRSHVNIRFLWHHRQSNVKAINTLNENIPDIYVSLVTETGIVSPYFTFACCFFSFGLNSAIV